MIEAVTHVIGAVTGELRPQSREFRLRSREFRVQVPLRSGCSGSFEVEGIDFDERDNTLRVVVMAPSICILWDSKTYRFRP
ncbi:hypothetical protein [Amycolatopsis sp. CA-128772]|uniref:hypothetical protein n=1 Tax=Amycolatopsis sp. CA-128772 TaxID=2073159 RepID=UPI0018ECEE2D|nr:hypothetical protein [Amycolatopsis sp. CA-128772]